MAGRKPPEDTYTQRRSEKEQLPLLETLESWKDVDSRDSELLAKLLSAPSPEAFQALHEDYAWLEWDFSSRFSSRDGFPLYWLHIHRRQYGNFAATPECIPVLIRILGSRDIYVGDVPSHDSFVSYSPHLWTFDILTRITGENFGVDEAAWTAWWNTEGQQRYDIDMPL